ncbi:MAG: metal-dependent hydrolase [Desulfovibrionaceae bacterium]|nr:metal-dependent hydrolase [Desulfovibrionaceae bacterium]
MPGYKGHLAGGLFVAGVGLFALYSLGWVQERHWFMAALAGFCLMGALFPDVDTDSVAQRLFYLLIVAVVCGLIVQRRFELAAYLGLFAMLPCLGKHRGWTHSWWAALLVPAPILATPYLLKFPYNQVLPGYVFEYDWTAFVPFYLAFVIGYLSHLFLDRGLKRA